MPGMLLIEGSVGVEDADTGPAGTFDDEASWVGVPDAQRDRTCVSRRDRECRIRASSAVGSTFLMNEVNVV